MSVANICINDDTLSCRDDKKYPGGCGCYRTETMYCGECGYECEESVYTKRGTPHLVPDEPDEEVCDHPPRAWRRCERCRDVVGDLRFHEDR